MIIKILYKSNEMNITLENDEIYGEIISKSLDIFNIYIYELSEIIAKDNEDKELFKFSDLNFNARNEFNFNKLELIERLYDEDNKVILSPLPNKYMYYTSLSDPLNRYLNEPNPLPTTMLENDQTTWRRLFINPFEYSFPNNEVIENENAANSTNDLGNVLTYTYTYRLPINNDELNNSNDENEESESVESNSDGQSAEHNSEEIERVQDQFIDEFNNSYINNTFINEFDNIFSNIIQTFNSAYPNTIPPIIQNEQEDIPIIAKKEELDKMKSFTFKEIVESNEKYLTNCSICLEDFKDNDICLYFNKCNHNYHEECIKKYLKNYSNKCPVCRCELIEGVPKIN